jgi:hypothetical protein
VSRLAQICMIVCPIATGLKLSRHQAGPEPGGSCGSLTLAVAVRCLPRPPGSQPDPGRPYSPTPRSIQAKAVRGRAAGASRDGALDHQPPVAAVRRPSQERTVIPCLQRARRLGHAVADLAMCDLHDRSAWRVVAGNCGQDCGQPGRGSLLLGERPTC